MWPRFYFWEWQTLSQMWWRMSGFPGLRQMATEFKDLTSGKPKKRKGRNLVLCKMWIRLQVLLINMLQWVWVFPPENYLYFLFLEKAPASSLCEEPGILSGILDSSVVCVVSTSHKSHTIQAFKLTFPLQLFLLSVMRVPYFSLTANWCLDMTLLCGPLAFPGPMRSLRRRNFETQRLTLPASIKPMLLEAFLVR